MFAEHFDLAQIPSAAGLLILAYYVIPYLLDPHDYRRRFSGPWLARFTNLWMSRIVTTGHHSEVIRELHEKYGTFLRIGPNHISIADPNAHEAVYGHGSGLLKSEFYQTFVNGHANTFSTQDRAEHARMRKRTTNVFSPQNVLAFEPRVQKYVRQLCVQWDTKCNSALKGISGFNWVANSGRAVIDCCPQFGYLAYDIIGDLALGAPFGMVEAQKDAAIMTRYISDSGLVECEPTEVPVIRALSGSGRVATATGVYPAWIQPWLLRLPWNLPGHRDTRNFLGMTVTAASGKIQRASEETQEARYERGMDIFDKLLEVRDENGEPLSRRELIGESIVLMIGGSDTTSNSLGALCYYLAAHPSTQRKLQAELDAHAPLELSDDSDMVINYQQVKGLPYLNACIKEIMRLHSTVGTGLPRVVPPGKAFTFGGETFKEGSVISVPSFTTNRASVWGPDAAEFRPERWLEDQASSFSKYYVPFSLGPRACLGRNLANMELLIIVATVFRRYDIQLADASTKLYVHEAFVREGLHCEVAVKRRAVAV